LGEQPNALALIMIAVADTAVNALIMSACAGSS
jgi:hypothetical protein